ncbi:hypothetical protein ACFQW6_19680 [Nocardioides sp. GCM10028917]|uniref:hypothetical protein n=1 Tax=Nocardioides sp. GCM10028917 TaxID=3273408 RepID=UPI00361FF16A
MKSLAALTAVTLLVAGCADSSNAPARTDPCDFRNVTAEVVSESEIASVPEAEANLVLDLSSTTREPTRVTVHFDRDVALDVRTPAVADECSHSPVYSHAFRLPGESVGLTVNTDQGRPRSVTVPLDEATHWVAVQPQDGFPIGLDVFDQEPAWG